LQIVNNIQKFISRSFSRYFITTFVAILVIVPLIATSGSFAVSQPVFSVPVNVSNDSGVARLPNVFNVGSHVYIAWTESSRGIIFRSSPDGGVTWSPPLNNPGLRISPKGGVAGPPLISANGTNVYVVWSQTIGNTGYQVMEGSSLNSGASFNPAVQITSGSPTGGWVTPVIASWGNNVYLAFVDSETTQSYVVVSTNAGQSWGKLHEYSTFHEPQLAAWGGKYIYAVAGQGLSVSSNNGLTWVNESITNCCPSEPWIAAYGANVYEVYETKGPCNQPSGGCVVGYAYSNNHGKTWSPQVNISATVSPKLPNSWAPMVNAFGNSSWIADHTFPNGSKSQVYVYTNTNAGKSWNSPVDLSGLSGRTSFPFNVATSDGKNVFVGWSQESSTKPVTWVMRVSYSADGGLTWSPAPGINASNNPLGTQAGNNQDLATGEISSFGTHCYVVYQLINGTSNQVYFTSS
jgi:hypothetical protein